MLFRKVDKRSWDWNDPALSWLPPGDIPAAPVSDFRASPTSRISVWYIDDDSLNLERIIAGMAAALTSTDKFDYVLFPESVLSELDLTAEESGGQSCDKDANSKWHRDLVKVSAGKLLKLVQLVQRNGNFRRSSEVSVIQLIRKSVDSGFIVKSHVNEKLRDRIFPN